MANLTNATCNLTCLPLYFVNEVSHQLMSEQTDQLDRGQSLTSCCCCCCCCFAVVVPEGQRLRQVFKKEKKKCNNNPAQSSNDVLVIKQMSECGVGELVLETCCRCGWQRPRRKWKTFISHSVFFFLVFFSCCWNNKRSDVYLGVSYEYTPHKTQLASISAHQRGLLVFFRWTAKICLIFFSESK